jgi:hypothetical protein
MAASGLHEAVKAPASVWSVLLFCVLSGSPGAIGWTQNAKCLEDAQKDIALLRVENATLKQALNDSKAENDRRFADMTERQKEMAKVLEKVADKVDRIADRVGAK